MKRQVEDDRNTGNCEIYVAYAAQQHTQPNTTQLCVAAVSAILDTKGRMVVTPVIATSDTICNILSHMIQGIACLYVDAPAERKQSARHSIWDDDCSRRSDINIQPLRKRYICNIAMYPSYIFIGHVDVPEVT